MIPIKLLHIDSKPKFLQQCTEVQKNRLHYSICLMFYMFDNCSPWFYSCDVAAYMRKFCMEYGCLEPAEKTINQTFNHQVNYSRRRIRGPRHRATPPGRVHPGATGWRGERGGLQLGAVSDMRGVRETLVSRARWSPTGRVNTSRSSAQLVLQRLRPAGTQLVPS